jgi:hypothetical protein
MRVFYKTLSSTVSVLPLWYARIPQECVVYLERCYMLTVYAVQRWPLRRHVYRLDHL